jgi:hypothetical protein
MKSIDQKATAHGLFFSHHSGLTNGNTATQSNKPANGIINHIGISIISNLLRNFLKLFQ